jgi:hypothetical protein
VVVNPKSSVIGTWQRSVFFLGETRAFLVRFSKEAQTLSIRYYPLSSAKADRAFDMGPFDTLDVADWSWHQGRKTSFGAGQETRDITSCQWRLGVGSQGAIQTKGLDG